MKCANLLQKKWIHACVSRALNVKNHSILDLKKSWRMSRWQPVARSWCRGILEQGDCSLQKVLCNTSDIGPLEPGGVSSTTAMVLMMHIDAPSSSGFGMLQAAAGCS